MEPRFITAAEVRLNELADVQGPASATDGHLAVFDGTTGKIIKDGGAPSGDAANLSIVDLGIIRLADVLRAGYIELLPYTAGQFIRKIFFSPDGFEPHLDANGWGTLSFFTPNTFGIALFGPGEADFAQDTDGMIAAKTATKLVNQGPLYVAQALQFGGQILDCGPLTAFLALPSSTVQAPRAWAATTRFAINDFVIDSNDHIQIVTGNGISGASEPAWDDSLGNTTDGTITWLDLGPISSADGAIHVFAEVVAMPDLEIQIPASIEFVQQPTNLVAGATFDPPVSVLVKDQNGDPYLLPMEYDLEIQVLGNGTLIAPGGQIIVDTTTGIATWDGENVIGISDPVTDCQLIVSPNFSCTPPLRLISNTFQVTSP